MPTPERTSLDAIVAAARDLLEEIGLAGVTMQAVASRVGVRAPSLYKRVQNRERLIQLVAEATLGDLADRLRPAGDARALLDSFRTFSKERPAAFQLVMVNETGIPTADPVVLAGSSEATLRIATDLAGEAHALEAARTLTAWAAGFVSMELNGNFRLGGDVEAAWAYGADAIVAAISRA